MKVGSRTKPFAELACCRAELRVADMGRVILVTFERKLGQKLSKIGAGTCLGVLQLY